MTTKKQKRCPECGIGKIVPSKGPGRFARYKTMHKLEIPDDLLIPTCDNCGAEWIDEKTAGDLDKALDQAYRAELRSRAVEAIQEITKHVSQRKLESVLGLSQGYLSKLRSGDRDPSAELVSQLALISRDPKKRINELVMYWEENHSTGVG